MGFWRAEHMWRAPRSQAESWRPHQQSHGCQGQLMAAAQLRAPPLTKDKAEWNRFHQAPRDRAANKLVCQKHLPHAGDQAAGALPSLPVPRRGTWVTALLVALQNRISSVTFPDRDSLSAQHRPLAKPCHKVSITTNWILHQDGFNWGREQDRCQY